MSGGVARTVVDEAMVDPLEWAQFAMLRMTQVHIAVDRQRRDTETNPLTAATATATAYARVLAFDRKEVPTDNNVQAGNGQSNRIGKDDQWIGIGNASWTSTFNYLLMATE